MKDVYYNIYLLLPIDLDFAVLYLKSKCQKLSILQEINDNQDIVVLIIYLKRT